MRYLPNTGSSISAGRDRQGNMHRARLLQRAGASTGGCTCGQNIVNEQDSLARKRTLVLGSERRANVHSTLGIRQARLWSGGLYTTNRVGHRHIPAPRQLLRDPLGLIEAARPSPRPMQRHGHYGIVQLLARNHLRDIVG